ncbi:zinc ribbon domain-containing protein [Paludisphaera rhizosphaerae]|uniref:zinc-ribbon domain-containing protein n=1 Tax=Paludisphaera rhizosphaerae TaxID=2711216 RepID=UPI0013EE1F50|nr:zinc-ribbon domain-containing protein [Paludisphaera rhizosphaerae]
MSTKRTVSTGHVNMPRTITCDQCQAVLNLPDQVPAGKRLKCPKCQHRFVVTIKDANSASTRPGELEAANATSTFSPAHTELPVFDDLPVPRAEGDLREAFDLPLLAGEAEKSLGASPAAAAVSDAAALFQDEPRRRRKAHGAEARSSARRCPRCGGVVPQGMSICQSCGTDADTGMFVGLDDDLTPPPPPRPTGIPLLIAVPGLLCGLAGGLLTILSLIQSVRVEPGVYQYGWLMLGVVAAYGVYGAVQFLRGKSVKVLILALTLGAIVNVISMIALPIFEANFAETADIVTQSQVAEDDPNANDLAATEYKPIIDRLDQTRIKSGVAMLILCAVMVAYLNSQPVKKYFFRKSIPTY